MNEVENSADTISQLFSKIFRKIIWTSWKDSVYSCNDAGFSKTNSAIRYFFK